MNNVQKRYIIIGIVILIFFIVLTAVICIPIGNNTTDTDGIDRIETRIGSIEERIGVISSQSRELVEQNKVFGELLTRFGNKLSDDIGAIQDIRDTANSTTDGIQISAEGLGRSINRVDNIEEGLSELERILRETENNHNTTESTVSN